MLKTSWDVSDVLYSLPKVVVDEMKKILHCLDIRKLHGFKRPLPMMSDLLVNRVPLTYAKEIFLYSFVSAF